MRPSCSFESPKIKLTNNFFSCKKNETVEWKSPGSEAIRFVINLKSLGRNLRRLINALSTSKSDDSFKQILSVFPLNFFFEKSAEKKFRVV